MPIIGNNLNNILVGTIGNDDIFGLAGNDVLVGLAGNDLLNGGTGADVMVGGTGNDRYMVDNVGDIVVEGFNEGIDTIVSSISLSLNAPGRFNVENLALLNVATALNGFGNNLNNVIAGNNFNNLLSGGGGNDRLFGNAGNDSLTGGSGNDLLIGGAGRDVLTGGFDNDTFDYNLASESPANIFRDIITDFDDFGNDTIDLSGVFGGVLAFRGGLPFNGVGQVRINNIIGPDVVVEVNLAGGLAPEMQILLANTSPLSMTATDFIL